MRPNSPLLKIAEQQTGPRQLLGEETSGAHYFRALLQRVSDFKSGLPKSIGITAATSGEGTSTVAVGLAMAAARELEINVVIVDANLEAPVQHLCFGVSQSDGWTDHLTNEDKLDNYIQTSNSPRISVVSAGTKPRVMRAAGVTEKFSNMIQELEHDFGLVIVDLPIADELTGCLSFVEATEGVLWVVEADRHSTESAERVKVRLVQRNARLLGVVMNRRRPRPL